MADGSYMMEVIVRCDSQIGIHCEANGRIVAVGGYAEVENSCSDENVRKVRSNVDEYTVKPLALPSINYAVTEEMVFHKAEMYQFIKSSKWFK